MTLLYILLSLCFISFYYYYYRDFLCPHIIFLSSWLLACSFSCIDYDDFMAPWCEEMYLVTILSALTYWLGSLCFCSRVRKRKYVQKEEVVSTFNYLLFALYLICLSCFIVEWVVGGMGTVLTADLSGDVKTQLSDAAIPGIHYGSLFLPYVAIIAIYAYMNSFSKIYRRAYFVIIFSIIAISIFCNLSRGDMLIYILAFIFIYSRYEKISKRLIFILIIILISIFIGFMFLRTDEDSIVMQTANNPYVSIFYSYIATCYANLNDYIMANHPYHWMGNATLAPLWTLTGMKNDATVILTEQLDVFNATTYLYGFYHDYKLLGIVVFPFT